MTLTLTSKMLKIGTFLESHVWVQNAKGIRETTCIIQPGGKRISDFILLRLINLSKYAQNCESCTTES